VLLGAAGGERGEANREEVQARERDEVHGELAEIGVELEVGELAEIGVELEVG
jgi:hypothetical protein